MEILILSLTRFGDLIQSTPLFYGLKQKYKDCRISVLVDESFKDVTELIPLIDHTYVFESTKLIPYLLEPNNNHIGFLYNSFKAFISHLMEKEFDLIINLSFIDESAILTYLLRSKEIKGSTLDEQGNRIIKDKWLNYFVNTFLNPSSLRNYSQFNIVDIYLRAGGIQNSPKRLFTKIPRHQEIGGQSFRFAKMLRHQDTKIPKIGLQACTSIEKKNWPAFSWRELAKILNNRLNAKIILIGAKREIALGKEIERGLDFPVINLIGKTNLIELAETLKELDLLITCDTGPMHLSASLGKKILALFLGPASAINTGPYGEGFYIIQPDIPCYPCNYQQKCENPVCKRVVTPEYVGYLSEKIIKNQEIEESLNFVNVYKTTFDKDGFFCLSLLKGQADRNEELNSAYRELWKEQLGSKNKQKMEIKNTQPFQDTPLKEGNKTSSKNEFKELGTIASEGIFLCQKLIQKILAKNNHGIKHIAKKINRLDDEIHTFGMVHENTRPLTLFFKLQKENMVKEDILHLTLRQSKLYRNLKESADRMYELLS